MGSKLELVRDFYQTVWIDGQVEQAHRFFDPAAEASGLLPDLAVGAQEFHEFAAALTSLLDVDGIHLAKAVEQDDWLAVMASFEATLQATGDRITGSGMLMVRIVDDKIVEAFNCIDFLGLFEKLGLVPQDALALCMAGQRLS